MRPRIGITLGDCAGVGPEIVDLALKSDRGPKSAGYKIVGKYPDCSLGQPTLETARAAAVALEEAITLARRGELDAIVTGPVHKARMYEVGFKFPGQTEFFAERCGVKNFAMCLTGGKMTVALVTAHLPLRKVASALQQSEVVRVGLLLADFLQRRSLSRGTSGNSTALSRQVSNVTMVARRGAARPRIAVAGLNPHAGQSGNCGMKAT